MDVDQRRSHGRRRRSESGRFTQLNGPAIAVARSSPADLRRHYGSTTVAFHPGDDEHRLDLTNVTAPLPNRSVMSIVVDPNNRDRAFGGSRHNASRAALGMCSHDESRLMGQCLGNLLTCWSTPLDPNNANHLSRAPTRV
jgi:hypothetical protein